MPDELGLVFTYSTRRVNSQPIEFSNLKELVTSLMIGVNERLEELLPSDLTLDDFRVQESALNDNMAFTDSIFTQNKDVFGPLADKVFDQLTRSGEGRYKLKRVKGNSSGTLCPKKAQTWFDKEKELLEQILGAISLSIGIPPRGFQMANLRYTSSETGKRNLFICKSNVILGFPLSKLYSRTIQEALWALPPGLSKSVLLYLGVIRPVSLQLADQLRWKRNPLSKTHIFAAVPSERETRASWDGSKLNTIVKSQTFSTLDIALSLSTLRQVITAIFRKHLNELIDSVDMARTSIANQSADHTQRTANNYGQNAGSLTGLSMSDTEIDQFMEVSHSWQALMGIRAPGQKLQERLHKVPALHLRDGNLIKAMERARHMVCRKYGIGGDTSEEKATKVLDMKPFFPKQGTDELGDQVLVEVISTLIYGHGRPGPKEAAPVDGYSVETILEAVAIIESVLKEWSTRTRSYPQNLAVKAQIGRYTNDKREYMTKILTSMEEEWIDLGKRVYLFTISTVE
jgi:hypothetical protein